MPPHIDYSSGYIPWEDVQGRPLMAYTCFDRDGRLVEVMPKNPDRHDSWHPVQADPAYHYNLGMILANPDGVTVSNSQNPQSLMHQQEGEVLTYHMHGYIMSLNMPSSPQFPTDTTEITVKYTDARNHTLTSQIFRTWS
jgi:hypothetical protein